MLSSTHIASMIMHLREIVCIAVAASPLISCKDSGSEPIVPPQSSIALSVEDASCTEAWLKLSTSAGPCSVTVRRDGQKIQDLYLTTRDSVIVDEGLLPKQTYVYQEFKLRGGSVIETTQQVQAKTLDTTSHNFTWQIDTLGDGNSSVLYDVAIINDTLAYAVGEMYRRDSLGNWDPDAYNLARWNGHAWQLLRIRFYTICGQSSFTPYPAKAIVAFSATDIWIAMHGDQVTHWDGATQMLTMCLPVSFSINKLWGEHAGSIYAVGDAGNILHFDGTFWQQLSSGTTLNIYDIYGDRNRFSGATEVLAVAGNRFVNLDRAILLINGNGVSQISSSGISSQLAGVWFSRGESYWVVGDGIFWKRSGLSEPSWKGGSNIITPYYSNAVWGSAINDLFVCGAYGDVVHFNGMTWQSYAPQTALASGQYYRIKTTGNLVFAVGYNSPRAVVARGIR